MRCSACGYSVPDWLWIGDDHPIIMQQQGPIITRTDSVEDNTMKITAESVVAIRMCRDVHPPTQNGDFIDIGKECFADKDALVISYKGENYYRACDELVYKDDEGTTHHCVKRVGHPQAMHEAYDGTQKGSVTHES